MSGARGRRELTPTYKEIDELCEKLVDVVNAQLAYSASPGFDMVIIIGDAGSSYVANYIGERLECAVSEIENNTVPPAMLPLAKGKSILLVSALCDSGRVFEDVSIELEEAGAYVATASLYETVREKEFSPDFIAVELDDDGYIKFPWEDE